MPFIGPVTNSSASIGSIADDMYFASTADRDTFTAANPNRLYQGVTCAVGTTTYDYYQWNDVTKDWAKANLIFQGQKGDFHGVLSFS